jgi:hypothetical protein
MLKYAVVFESGNAACLGAGIDSEDSHERIVLEQDE